MIALLPNFGAEEGDEGAVANRPELRVAALLWRELFPSSTIVIGVDAAPPLLGPHEGPAFPWLPVAGGVPWLSTAAAERRLARLGFPLAAASPEVVRRVHDKGWAQRVARELGLCPLGERVQVFDMGDLDRLPAAVAALPPGAWAIKPRFGSSGRGRVPLSAIAGALPRLAKRGGAVLEPWLDRIEDLSAQLHVARDGAVEVLGSTRQLLSPSGVYFGNACVLDGDRPRAGTPWDDELERAAVAIARAAAAEGYIGPCGVDAFVYRDASGEPVLRPVVELNARFTMGTAALGILRRLQQRGERPHTFTFALREHGAGHRVPLVGAASAYLD